MVRGRRVANHDRVAAQRQRGLEAAAVAVVQLEQRLPGA